MSWYRAPAGLLVILLLLQLLAEVFAIPGYVFAPPSQALAAVQEDLSFFSRAALFTLGNAFFGFLLACVAAAVAVVGSYISKPIELVCVTVVDAIQSFPKESLFPIFILWLGFGAEGKILNAMLLATVPLFVTAFEAIRNARSDYVQLFRSFGPASRFAELLQCRLPQSVPAVHAAVRLALPLALVGSVLGEFLGGGVGLGHIIITAATAFRIDRAFASIYILAGVGVLALSVVDITFRVGLGTYFLGVRTHQN